MRPQMLTQILEESLQRDQQRLLHGRGVGGDLGHEPAAQINHCLLGRKDLGRRGRARRRRLGLTLAEFHFGQVQGVGDLLLGEFLPCRRIRAFRGA